MKKKIEKAKQSLKETSMVQRVKDWWLQVTIPGLDGVPISKVAAFMAEELQKDKIGPRAGAISFSFLLAMFPTLIFVFSLIPMINIDGLQENIFSLLQSVLPEEAFRLARNTIEDTITKKRFDRLSFGLVLMVVFATNGMNAILKTFSKINPAFKQRSFVKEYGVAFLLTVILGIFFFISITLILFGQNLIEHLLRDEFSVMSSVTYWVLIVVKWVLIIIIYFLGISIVYYIGPALKTKWRFISIGGTVATLLSIGASLGFGLYVNNFGQYNKFYGSLGTIIIIMSWMWINSMALLLGFELNNSIRLFQLSQEESSIDKLNEDFKTDTE